MTDQLDELLGKLEDNAYYDCQIKNTPKIKANYRALVEVIRDLLNNADTSCGIDRATVYERVNLKIQELLR